MPYKSDAQRKKFHVMEEKGEMSKKVVNEFDQASKGMKLPEHKKWSKHGYSMGGKHKEA